MWLIYILGLPHREACFIHPSKAGFLKSLVVRPRTGLPGHESGFEGMERDVEEGTAELGTDGTWDG